MEMIKHFKNSNWGQIFKMLFLTLGVVRCPWLFRGPSGTSVSPLAPPGGSSAVYYAHYLIIMGLGLHPTVEFPGVCDIWFVEISNINPRNVIKNSSADHLLQETCYYTNDWFHKLYKAVWQKNLELKQR